MREVKKLHSQKLLIKKFTELIKMKQNSSSEANRNHHSHLKYELSTSQFHDYIPSPHLLRHLQLIDYPYTDSSLYFLYHLIDKILKNQSKKKEKV